MFTQKFKQIIYSSIFFSLFILIIFQFYRSFIYQTFIIQDFQSQNYLKTDRNWYTFKGQTKNLTHIWLNNQEISITTDGNFSKKVYLYPGFNQFIWTYQSKNGIKKNQKITIFKIQKSKKLKENL